MGNIFIKNKKQRKGQEEIVGFVSIVLIVSFIFLIFLGISLRKGPEFKKESKDVSMFLESAMEYTTDCADGYEPNYMSLRRAIKGCYEGKKCAGSYEGREACNIANETLKEMIDLSWRIGGERAIKGYIFNSEYGLNSSSGEKDSEKILIIESGNCSSGNIAGAENFFSAYPGKISYSLSLCF
ncbi:hypothetical protein HYW75_00805 [Candidatus Pacearchaeota archaeon]|nr:hypothetical protein [Candidatus Pacearchaeota archaeon]